MALAAVIVARQRKANCYDDLVTVIDKLKNVVSIVLGVFGFDILEPFAFG